MLSIVAFLVGVAYSIVTTSYDALPVISLYLVYSLATNFIEVFHAIDQRHLRLDFAGKSYVMQGLARSLLSQWACGFLILCSSLWVS